MISFFFFFFFLGLFYKTYATPTQVPTPPQFVSKLKNERAVCESIIQHLHFWLSPMEQFTIQAKMQKRACPYIFGSYGTIYTFKKYFVTMFLTINFQFSTNKRYLNRP